uniref:CR-type domain-containing protein n=1 Tax=Chromera velia CCMP2878 TaxID=1169474 RepID=A0A0G4HB66_9ALVE|eukprot:Cvel_25772.t1-p1 / transcript=Cvel_25772.t1 / gene=Cvel_25772 / organism=Chromera_velia_CCMP2878 / gene_product=Zinc finger protein 345, putative / transcript_product=Zinc finger protein 345, putative / location=Cvel_scaffold2969:6166-6942(-) / protein_length=259 / sequence_SO=supercontig / SO=protein_coding / is_pseudo=false
MEKEGGEGKGNDPIGPMGQEAGDQDLREEGVEGAQQSAGTGGGGDLAVSPAEDELHPLHDAASKADSTDTMEELFGDMQLKAEEQGFRMGKAETGEAGETARPKWTRAKEGGEDTVCPHGRKHAKYCKECGGSGICEHGRVRYRCKECGGGSICEHGRVRYWCKECGGGCICEHGRARYYCKDCDGKGVCEHGRLKRDCKECGGSALCKHSKRRTLCKECGGKSICEHGRLRYECKECGGKSLCEHGHQRYLCRGEGDL